MVLVDEGVMTNEAAKKYGDWMYENAMDCGAGYMFDNFVLEEIMIDEDGHLCITLTMGKDVCGQVFVDIDLSFEEWFIKLLKKGYIDRLRSVIQKKSNELSETIGKLDQVIEEIKDW